MNENKPKIRKKTNNDEWKQFKVGDLCFISTGRSNTQDKDDRGIYPFFVRSDIVEKSNKYLYDEEAVITIGDGVGTGKVYHYINGKYDLHQRCYRMFDFNNIDPKFFYYLFSQNFYQQVMKMSAKTSVDSVRLDMIKKLELYIPDNIDVQRFLSNMISNIDSLLDKENKKLQKLKNLKSAMLTKMFPKKGSRVPEIRFKGFSGEWRFEIFGKLVTIDRGGSPRPIEDYITNDNNGLNWIKIGDAPKYGNYITSTKEKIKFEGLSKTREVHPNDLILSNSMSFGKPYILKIDGCIHDGWLLIRNDKNIFDLYYLCLLLSSNNMMEQYRSLAAGSTVNNLNKELVSNVEVSFPTIDEQKKIGRCFNNLDSLIEKQNQKIEKLNQIKKAFIDKMFIQ